MFNGKTMVLIDPPLGRKHGPRWDPTGRKTFSTNISTALCFREALMVATASKAVSRR
jgi:hypothetical protein